MKVGFCGLLQLLFIGLKLGNVIEWSWLWVLTPTWLPVLVMIGLVVVTVMVAASDKKAL